MLTPARIAFLERLFPGDALLLTPEALSAYALDAGRIPGLPWAVVRPQNREQIVELLAWAHAERLPIIPRARGTNRVGAASPLIPGEQGLMEGGIVLSCLNLDRILDVDAGDFAAVAEPGVVTADLKAAAEAKGLMYPPDPASLGYSTLGGNVATNAGGMSALKYGVTRDHLLGLEAVLPGGRVIRLGGRVHKNAAGLDLLRLFPGSEGTLGVITELTLKLLPKPEASASLLAAFGSLDAALDAARAIFASGCLPAAMELFCDRTIQALAAANVPAPWKPGTDAALLLRLDGTAAAVSAEAARLADLLRSADMADVHAAPDPASEEALWDIRRAVSQATFALAPDKLSDDVTVPRSRIAALIAGPGGRREIEACYGLPIVSFGHLGDGNLHVGVLYDASRPGEARKAAQARQDLSDLALKLGGTLSGEHGVGLAKLARLPRQFTPETLALMRQVKAAFDPHGIMNPGKGY